MYKILKGVWWKAGESTAQDQCYWGGQGMKAQAKRLTNGILTAVSFTSKFSKSNSSSFSRSAISLAPNFGCSGFCSVSWNHNNSIYYILNQNT